MQRLRPPPGFLRKVPIAPPLGDPTPVQALARTMRGWSGETGLSTVTVAKHPACLGTAHMAEVWFIHETVILPVGGAPQVPKVRRVCASLRPNYLEDMGFIGGSKQ